MPQVPPKEPRFVSADLPLNASLNRMPQAAPAAPTAPTTAWLIERGQDEGQVPTLWWCRPGKGDYKYGRRWTEDANKAHRFASFSKAMRPYDNGGLGDWEDAPVNGDGDLLLCHATEHVWLDAAPAAPTAAPNVELLCKRLLGARAWPPSETVTWASLCEEAAAALLALQSRVAEIERDKATAEQDESDMNIIALGFQRRAEKAESVLKEVRNECEGIRDYSPFARTLIEKIDRAKGNTDANN